MQQAEENAGLWWRFVRQAIPLAVRPQLELAQAQRLVRLTPAVAAGHLSCSAVLAIVFGPATGYFATILWLAAIWILAGHQLKRWYRRQGASLPLTSAGGVIRRAVLRAGILGLIWGGGSILFFPADAHHLQVFLTLAVGGMAAGATAILATTPAVALAFMAPCVLPITARLLATGETVQAASASLLALYFTALVFAVGLIYRDFVASKVVEIERDRLAQELRRESDSLERRVGERTQELSESNRRLRQEIGERRRAEAALAEREARYRLLFEAAPIPIREVDLSAAMAMIGALGIADTARFDAYIDGHDDFVRACGRAVRVIDVNEQGLRLHQASSKEAYLEQVTATMSDASVQLLGRLLKLLYRGERSIAAEGMMLRPDGSERSIMISGSVVPGHEASYDRVLLCTVDMTERVEAEAALERGRETLQALIEHGSDLILSYDWDGRVTFESPSIGRILGYPGGSLRERPFAELVHQEDRALYQSVFRQVMETRGKPVTATVRARHLDGGWRKLEAVFTGLRDGGPIDGVIANLRDVTERDAIEQQLRQAQKMEAVGQLTGGVAHDFNNLLAVVLGNLELLEERVAQDPTSSRHVADAIVATYRGSDLTNRLLAFARKQMLDPVVLDLNDLVKQDLELIRRLLDETIEVATELCAEPLITRIDRPQFSAAMINLAINARDAMPAGGKLTISTERLHGPGGSAASCLEVAVTDSGQGIPDHVLPRVFEPFFSTKEFGKGSGLGLSMVFGFVNQSGGKVAIESAVGRGTSVRLRFPALDQAARGELVADAPQAIEHGPHKGRVLLVEDNEMLRALTARSLEVMGFTVDGAPNGVLALDKLMAEGEYALLITDIKLPGGMLGDEIVRAARRLRPTLPVMLISADLDAATLAADALGTCAFLPKPFTRVDLARQIGKLLDESPG